jgi:hypothetical protein
MEKVIRFVSLIFGLSSAYIVVLLYKKIGQLIEYIVSYIEINNLATTVAFGIVSFCITFIIFAILLVAGVILTTKLLYYKEITIAYAFLVIVAFFAGVFPETPFSLYHFIGWYAFGVGGLGSQSDHRLFGDSR